MKYPAFPVLPLVALILTSCGDDKSEKGPPRGDFPVEVAKPISKTVELTEVYTGRFEAVESVDLRARVSGYIESVHFEEGQEIKKGDLMFQIDPRPFDAVQAAADAMVKQAEAQVSLAKNNLDRAQRLVASNAISKEETDIRASEYAQAQADLLAAKADLQASNLDREFADVKAPINGIASQYLITPGNFISGGGSGSDLLATIVPHSPIYCVFQVDERQVLKFTRMFFEGDAAGRDASEETPVEIAVSDDEEFAFDGNIMFAENRLDESTATMSMRALVENKDKFLTPGLFGRVRVNIGNPFEAILVPDSALGFDQSKRFAWRLEDDSTVKRVFVEVGSLEGDMRIIESGLEPDDQIVTSGIQLLQDGMKVAPGAGGKEKGKGKGKGKSEGEAKSETGSPPAGEEEKSEAEEPSGKEEDAAAAKDQDEKPAADTEKEASE